MARSNEPSSKLVAVLKDIPAADAAAAGKVAQKLISGGAATINELIELVGQKFGDPAGATPKYALHAAVLYAGRPGDDKARKTVAEALADQLAKDHSPELKAFIIRQLQFCGRADEVGALAKFLGDKRLCEPATQAMLAIGGEESAAGLRKALGSANGKLRVTLLNAVGRLRDKPSAPAARGLLGDKERDVRIAAMYALGNIGDSESAGVLLKAAGGAESFERTQAVDACLLLARSLAAQGDKAGAARTCRAMPTDRSYDRCAALSVLAQTCGVEAFKDLMDAMDCKDVKVRNPAACTAVKLSTAIEKSHSAQADKLRKKAVKANSSAGH
ncbi:MAG: HEAT repeat domain-containing protein [Phycisphaerae bacterium]|nr:HEAT repeat domain-containing protein [Phycisphaerae bacterium]MDP7287152.1 HEAT repeat domain-containing protein [Phycisphaerae bacterium]